MNSIPGKRKTNFLYIHQNMGTGGAEEVRSVLVNNIDKEKFNVTLCCIGEKGEIAQKLSEKVGGLHNISPTFARQNSCMEDAIKFCNLLLQI